MGNSIVSEADDQVAQARARLENQEVNASNTAWIKAPMTAATVNERGRSDRRPPPIRTSQRQETDDVADESERIGQHVALEDVEDALPDGRPKAHGESRDTEPDDGNQKEVG